MKEARADHTPGEIVVAQGLAAFSCFMVVDVLTKTGKQPSSALKLPLARAQGLETISIIIFPLSLYISSRQVGFSIGAWADSYPFSAPLGLSLLSTLYICQTDTAAADKHEDLKQRLSWDCILKSV